MLRYISCLPCSFSIFPFSFFICPNKFIYYITLSYSVKTILTLGNISSTPSLVSSTFSFLIPHYAITLLYIVLTYYIIHCHNLLGKDFCTLGYLACLHRSFRHSSFLWPHYSITLRCTILTFHITLFYLKHNIVLLVIYLACLHRFSHISNLITL